MRVELICGREKYMATISVVPFRIFVREDLKRGKLCAYLLPSNFPKQRNLRFPAALAFLPVNESNSPRCPKASHPRLERLVREGAPSPHNPMAIFPHAIVSPSCMNHSINEVAHLRTIRMGSAKLRANGGMRWGIVEDGDGIWGLEGW